MDMVAKVYVSTLDCHHYYHRSSGQVLPTGNVLRPFIGKGFRRRIVVQPCRSFKSEDVGPREYVKGSKSVNKLVGAIRSAVWSCSKPSLRTENKLREAMEKLEERLFLLALYVGRYIITMMSTGVVMFVGFQLSGGDSQMNELIWYSWLGGIIIGTMIGSNLVLDEVARAGPRNVVITGSTRGLGKALVREFLLSGDRVIVTSRSPVSVRLTIEELEENLKQAVNAATGSARKRLAHAKVVGMACDVSEPVDVRKLGKFATDELGYIDIWVNNAGTNKGFRPLLQFTDNDIQEIVSTNLIGSILCTKEAIQIMKTQSKGGHVFNMDGAGSGGSSTPLTAVYGSTKCGLRQLQSSLLKECKRSKVGVHTASPGMVLTDLLLRRWLIMILIHMIRFSLFQSRKCSAFLSCFFSGSTIQNRQMFNIICEHPETVARTLVPRMRVVKGSGRAINYLTPPRILIALVTAWLRRGRWFDDQGRALYAAEADRLRNWAESRTRFSFTDAMEMYTENTWISVFSLSVVCAFIILSSTGST